MPFPSDDLKFLKRAICRSRTCEGANCCQWPANGGRTNCPVKNGGYDDAAHDALTTLTECGWGKVEWLPIESAPKDGSYIIANAKGEVCACDAARGQRIVHNKPGHADWTYGEAATLWMPFPRVPTPPQQKEPG